MLPEHNVKVFLSAQKGQDYCGINILEENTTYCYRSQTVSLFAFDTITSLSNDIKSIFETLLVGSSL